MNSPTSKEDVWTVQSILQWTSGFLQEKGISAPRLESELLLAHARQCQRIHLYADFDAPLSDDERARMREMVKRRAAREPLAYITGLREFYGREFEIERGVLVPRPETETLIDVCLEYLAADSDAHVCEIGVGSGCISVTLALQRPQLQLTATDLSEIALNCAVRNVAKYSLDRRVTIQRADLFPDNHPLFDGIVSNPPYVTAGELSDLEPEVSVHEPQDALVSGADGLDCLRAIISRACDTLKPEGWIALEMDPAQCATVTTLLDAEGFGDVKTVQDCFGVDRIVHARRAVSESR